MSILAKTDRQDLVWSMRKSLLEQVKTSGILTEGKKAAANDFIINEASYEQLLNLAFNPERETNYKSVEVLEKVALETYSSILESENSEEKKEEKKLEKKEKEEEAKEDKKEKEEEAKEEKLEKKLEEKLEKKEKELEKKAAVKESILSKLEESAKEKAKVILGKIRDPGMKKKVTKESAVTEAVKDVKPGIFQKSKNAIIQGTKKTGEIVRTHPKTAVVTALGTGLLAARALKKRRERQAAKAAEATAALSQA